MLHNPAKFAGSPPKRQLNLRLDARIYGMVRERASVEGRTMNSAAAELIQRGHDDERDLEQVFGSSAGYAVARLLLSAAEAAMVKSGTDRGFWLQDAGLFDQASQAIAGVLETLRPGPVQEALAAVEAERTKR